MMIAARGVDVDYHRKRWPHSPRGFLLWSGQLQLQYSPCSKYGLSPHTVALLTSGFSLFSSSCSTSAGSPGPGTRPGWTPPPRTSSGCAPRCGGQVRREREREGTLPFLALPQPFLPKTDAFASGAAAKEERVLFHYNGHGVPREPATNSSPSPAFGCATSPLTAVPFRLAPPPPPEGPTANGELWVFNSNYTQYIPLPVAGERRSPTVHAGNMDCHRT